MVVFVIKDDCLRKTEIIGSGDAESFIRIVKKYKAQVLIYKEGEIMVRIITDSSADFEPQELENKNIICVPMQIFIDGREYKENVDLTKDEFYSLLKNCNDLPKTSQPSPDDFESVFSDLKASSDECVVITVSSALSGTYQNAVISKNTIDFEDCYITDSLNVAGGERILVEHAVKLRDEGKTASQIYTELEKLKKRIVLVACVDTLEYLYKGGRLSKTSYAVGSLANIKPIIEITSDGLVAVTGKTMSIRKSIRNMCDRLVTKKPDMNYPIYIVYSHNKDNAFLLSKQLYQLGYEVDEKRMFNIGAAIASHAGSNACGVVYISK